MDIFITEPLVDWEKLARRLAVAQEGDDNVSQWFPADKLRIVQRKLNGDNPADIMIAELQTSVHKKHKVRGSVKCAQGDSRDVGHEATGIHCSRCKGRECSRGTTGPAMLECGQSGCVLGGSRYGPERAGKNVRWVGTVGMS